MIWKCLQAVCLVKKGGYERIYCFTIITTRIQTSSPPPPPPAPQGAHMEGYANLKVFPLLAYSGFSMLLGG